MKTTHYFERKGFAARLQEDRSVIEGRNVYLYCGYAPVEGARVLVWRCWYLLHDEVVYYVGDESIGPVTHWRLTVERLIWIGGLVTQEKLNLVWDGDAQGVGDIPIAVEGVS